MPEPLTPEQFDDEVWVWRTQRMFARAERMSDRRDRWREQDSWPDEIRNARPLGRFAV